MTGSQMDSLERLKQHFAQRVINQSRQLLELWQNLQGTQWSVQELVNMQDAAQRLLRYAERFEQHAHLAIARALLENLTAIENNGNRLNSQFIETMTQLLQDLLQTGLRQGENIDNVFLPPMVRKPLYVALQDPEKAKRFTQQLQSFALQAEVFSDEASFLAAMTLRHPALIILDVDFVAAEQGLQLAHVLKTEHDSHVPILFYSREEVDAQTRLAAVRAGGQAFFIGELDASSVLEKVEGLARMAQSEPYRALVIDDSRAQAIFTERVLNSAGIITRAINDPTLALAELLDFDPDLIILDMYMPQCDGPELAKVIRHIDRFVGVPIIYLSAEDDLDKQLDAMSEGADDFLMKPVKPRHLVATVRNRAARARNLKSRIVRDSLTGLFNHTYILQLLDDAQMRAQKTQQPLCFVMIDIDYFKQVNDTYGHPMGDKVIKGLSLFLKQRLRRTDSIGRYGGEEFAVILPNTDAQSAQKVMNDIRQLFAEIRFPAQPNALMCTFSAGIVEYDGQADTTRLAVLADEALYAAKHAGRNCVRIYSPSEEQHVC
ncbi:MAG: diguanylate cyclase [Pseudomonas sp.]|nr:diguanylate cyclase [Pseudomonas sp.]